MAETKREDLEYSPSTDKQSAILGTLEGPCADIIHPTRNGRKYSQELWEKVFENPLVQELFKAGGITGELGHPADRTETDMEKIAICMPEPPRKNNKGELIGRWDILNTPNGRILKCLCDYGYKVGISSRGTGEIVEGIDGSEEVDPDSYEFTAFDIVLIPAVKSARLNLVTESLGTEKGGLKKALCEALETSNADEKKVMEETLETLNIDYLPEKADDTEVNSETDTTAEDNGVTLVKDLQEALKAKKELEDTVTRLQEKLSVCYAKETKQEEELDSLRKSVNSLSEASKKSESLAKRIPQLVEQLKGRDRKIAEMQETMSKNAKARRSLSESISRNEATVSKLEEQISSLRKRLNDTTSNATKEKHELEEQLQTARTDLAIKRSEYSDKLAKANAVTEKYRKIAKASIDRYIESKATLLGVSSQDIKNKLSENYSFDEIDRVCESLKNYRVNMSKLPFDATVSRRGKVQVKVAESHEPIVPTNGIDDEIDPLLIGLIGQ